MYVVYISIPFYYYIYIIVLYYIIYIGCYYQPDLKWSEWFVFSRSLCFLITCDMSLMYFLPLCCRWNIPLYFTLLFGSDLLWVKKTNQHKPNKPNQKVFIIPKCSASVPLAPRPPQLTLSHFYLCCMSQCSCCFLSFLHLNWIKFNFFHHEFSHRFFSSFLLGPICFSSDKFPQQSTRNHFLGTIWLWLLIPSTIFL